VLVKDVSIDGDTKEDLFLNDEIFLYIATGPSKWDCVGFRTIEGSNFYFYFI